MRRSPLSLALLAVVVALPGCGGLGIFGGSDLTALEVAGRYRFVEYTLDPVSDAVREARLLGGTVSEDMTLLLREDGTAALQRLRGDRVDETLASGVFSVSGETVRLRFDDGDALDGIYMPREVAFEADGQSLSAEAFREGVDLERISGNYRGITRADVTLRVRLREIG
ncbi:MAG: hypothetical protein AAF845_14010 [Bacteroidota bacterium]